MTDTSTAARPVVAVIGGGYGGFAVAKGLDEFADVTLVEPRDAFVHNVAALRALVEPEWLPAIFLPYDRLPANGRVVTGTGRRDRRRPNPAVLGRRTHPRLRRPRHRVDLPLPGQDGHRRHCCRHQPLPAEPRRARACRTGPDRRRRPDRARACGRDRRPLAGEADHDSRARARHPRRPIQTGTSRRSAPPTRAARRRVRSR